jgi:hypothetical protein
MTPSLLVRTLIGMLALEWELCGEDPVVFCYRMSVSLRESSSKDSPSDGNSFTGTGAGSDPQRQGCGTYLQPAMANDRISGAFTSFPVQR